MSEEKPAGRAHPDLYEGLSGLDRRAAELLASTRFADAETKKRIHSALRAAPDRRRRHFPRALVLVPAGLALLAALMFLARPADRTFSRARGGSRIYVDLDSKYYSAEKIHAVLRRS